MEVKSIAKNIRVSPSKVRIIADQIRSLEPQNAVKMLDFVNKRGSKPLKKAILSAIANAVNNTNLDTESLTFKEINVQKGMVFKRYRPISRGRAHSILKQTSNIRVILNGSEKKKEIKKIENVKETEEVKNGTKS